MTPACFCLMKIPRILLIWRLLKNRLGRLRNKKHFVWRFLGRQKCYHTQYRYLNSKIFLEKIMKDKHSVEQVEVESLYSIVQISYDQ